MLDLHLHILPGDDDGSLDEEMSLKMAEIALLSGVDTVAATPHANQMGRFENFYGDRLAGKFESLRKLFREKDISLRVLEGQEIMASVEMAERIERGLLIGLNKTDRYLIEFPFSAEDWWIEDRLTEVLALGKTPLAAHVERYDAVIRDPLLIRKWRQMGCLIQVNRGSLFGRFGEGPFQAADFLLRMDLVDCIASDAHGSDWRTPWLMDAYEAVADRFGAERAARLLDINPKRIVFGADIIR
ncbi:MAG: hypothetical protein K6E30_11255 [Lachnospiraceae bacterium]|nr:hypothetical protein [Lachnospiraceae bacterium]